MSFIFNELIIGPHKTPDSCLVMRRQPAAFIQDAHVTLKKPPAPVGGKITEKSKEDMK
jgi:hypothetical protein